MHTHELIVVFKINRHFSFSVSDRLSIVKHSVPLKTETVISNKKYTVVSSNMRNENRVVYLNNKKIQVKKHRPPSVHLIHKTNYPHSFCALKALVAEVESDQNR